MTWVENVGLIYFRNYYLITCSTIQLVYTTGCNSTKFERPGTNISVRIEWVSDIPFRPEDQQKYRIPQTHAILREKHCNDVSSLL